MTWSCEISKLASHQLVRLPHDRQAQIAHALERIQDNPLSGDVRPIKSGSLKGVLRMRVGRYRIIFSLNQERHTVMVAAILIRNEGTYK